eukprot:5133682-Prymnesium_polylepis.1
MPLYQETTLLSNDRALSADRRGTHGGANGGCHAQRRALQTKSALVSIEPVPRTMRTATASIHIDR